jgi:hypothetical protein
MSLNRPNTRPFAEILVLLLGFNAGCQVRGSRSDAVGSAENVRGAPALGADASTNAALASGAREREGADASVVTLQPSQADAGQANRGKVPALRDAPVGTAPYFDPYRVYFVGVTAEHGASGNWGPPWAIAPVEAPDDAVLGIDAFAPAFIRRDGTMIYSGESYWLMREFHVDEWLPDGAFPDVHLGEPEVDSELPCPFTEGVQRQNRVTWDGAARGRRIRLVRSGRHRCVSREGERHVDWPGWRHARW